MAKRIPVTGGKDHIPVFDRNGDRVHVGDIMHVQYCSGRYGQTAFVTETVTEAHWEYCAHRHIQTRYDYSTRRLVCGYTHSDVEHGHEVWAEIIGKENV